jgi:acyl-CoA reductase-like NAD-dependent aldehyde dehydrogenase
MAHHARPPARRARIADAMEAAAPAKAGELESFNPATGERLGSVPATRPDEVQAVVDEAAELQPFWAQLPLAARARHMRRTAQVILDSLDDLAELIAREQGKPRTEAYTMELLPTVDALHWLADRAPKLLRDERVRDMPLFVAHRRHAHAFEPYGAVAVVAPWNYPWSIPFGEVAMALMAGNAVVLKSAEQTPLIGQRIQDTFERAGLPQGIVRCVHGDGEVGRALVGSSVKKVFFTGSVEAGRSVAADCAEQLKGCVLELGGKDAALVLDDASVDTAAAGVQWGGFANAGQTCSGIERVYVARAVADPFVDRLVKGANALRLGDPMEWTTEIGPMTDEPTFERVCELVDDAVSNGAELRCGGPVEAPEGLEGRFFAPAVLTGVSPEMRIMREEVFGPVVPVIAVDSEEEAIRLANDSEFGLGASVWSRDRDRARRVAARLQTGMTWVNDHMYTHGTIQCAWGGAKSSGLGRSHGRFGLYECVNVKTVSWDIARLRDFWWHPYDGELAEAVTAAAGIVYGRAGGRFDSLRASARPVAQLARRAMGQVSR